MNPIEDMLDASGAALFQEIKRLLGIVDRPWCSVKQAMAYTGYSRTSILEAWRRGDLKGYKPNNGEHRFHKLALDAWIMGRKQSKRHRIPDPIHPAEQRSKGILAI